ncbi:beta-lactamase family protein [Paenibacillus sp. N4]|uniref:serine hydrolase domain-containing protein n=1 Tax=Paenibacillus vietnamensis TaxID=2590547 RepID=UPI001CD185F9|nr:serine hydrolase domain-containing protein [Paenibacillus vietnamensis]MCA0757123.1 beta-lactamase family protein [Paenibacillus vietnamensis]
MHKAGLLSNEVLSRRLDDYCTTLSRQGYLNGCVLAASEGRIALCKGYGMANFEHDIPNTPRTAFRIGSITKQFTAMAILMMYDQKLLDLYDPLSKYMPEFPDGDRITIHHLLTHSSGIPNFTSSEAYWSNIRLASGIEETIASFADKPFLFEPGERFDYSNSGYVLLSGIIERVSKLSYEDYIYRTILKPLGMIQSGHDSARKLVKNRASGYELWGSVVNAEFIDMSIPSGAGALYSTIEDLYIWGLSLHTHRLIKESTYVRMTTPYMEHYGYGLFLYNEEINGRSRRVAGHGGGINGFMSEMKHYRDEDLTIIVLSNLASNEVGRICTALARIALGEEVAPPPSYETIRVHDRVLKAAAGSYSSPDAPDAPFSLSYENGKLYLAQRTWFKVELFPYREESGILLFYPNGVEGKVTYTDDGELKKLRIEMFGGVKTAICERSNREAEDILFNYKK